MGKTKRAQNEFSGSWTADVSGSDTQSNDISCRPSRGRSVGRYRRQQTKDVLAKIDALLAEATTDKTNILFATVWLTDMSSFSQMNTVWVAWFATCAPPARATVASPRLVSPDFNIEIAVVAARL